jgi:hypothetical protein
LDSKESAIKKPKNFIMEETNIEKHKGNFGNVVLDSMPNLYGNMKRICKTEYKYVSVVTYDGRPTFRAEIRKYKWMKCFASCREAALAVDKKMIEKGNQPVNILVKHLQYTIK